MKINIWSALLTAFVICGALGRVLIPFLHKLKFGQEIRGCGPKEHLKKAGTPTMGGVLIILAVLVTSAVWAVWNGRLAVAMLLTLGYGLIGFLDDYIKIGMHRNLGLTSKQKLGLQLLLAALYVGYGVQHNFSTELWVPGFNCYLDLGYAYYLLVVILLAGTTNAVNLTDGLDGLVSSVTIPVVLTLGFFARTLEEDAMVIFAVAVVGALLGFLFYNWHPAKVFMGDTGSLALGGAVAALALNLHCELLLIILGGVYVMEALSVILQVGSFKLRHGKRIFRMSPLHHHFELGGWSEVKTVVIFTLVSCLCCCISIGLWIWQFVI